MDPKGKSTSRVLQSRIGGSMIQYTVPYYTILYYTRLTQNWGFYLLDPPGGSSARGAPDSGHRGRQGTGSQGRWAAKARSSSQIMPSPNDKHPQAPNNKCCPEDGSSLVYKQTNRLKAYICVSLAILAQVLAQPVFHVLFLVRTSEP